MSMCTPIATVATSVTPDFTLVGILTGSPNDLPTVVKVRDTLTELGIKSEIVVVFPTETVYGLGADAENGEAVRRIFSIKGRPADHPLIVHLADISSIDRWAREVPDAALRLAER